MMQTIQADTIRPAAPLTSPEAPNLDCQTDRSAFLALTIFQQIDLAYDLAYRAMQGRDDGTVNAVVSTWRRYARIAQHVAHIRRYSLPRPLYLHEARRKDLYSTLPRWARW